MKKFIILGVVCLIALAVWAASPTFNSFQAPLAGNESANTVGLTGIVPLPNGGTGVPLNTNFISIGTVYTNDATLGGSWGVQLTAGTVYTVWSQNNGIDGGLVNAGGSTQYTFPGQATNFTAPSTATYYFVDLNGSGGDPVISQISVLSTNIIQLAAQVVAGNLSASSLAAGNVAFNTPLSPNSGGSGSNNFAGAVAAAVGAQGYAVTNAASATQTFYGRNIFNDGLFSIGASTLSPAQDSTKPFRMLSIIFQYNTNLMSSNNGVGVDALLYVYDPNPYVDVGIGFPIYGTNAIGNLVATNSDGNKIYQQDQFGTVLCNIQDANTNREANQAGEFAIIMNGTTVGKPWNFSQNVQLPGDPNTGGGGNQHATLTWISQGLTNSTKFAGWAFEVLKAGIWSSTNSGAVFAMTINATNGQVTIASNLNVQSTIVIGASTNTATGTLIQTNFISGKLYTNIYGRPITVSANATLTETGVSGNASMSLLASTYLTNVFGESTIATSIATSKTNVLSMVIPANQQYTFTNTSAGAGDSSSVLGGQILVQ